MCNHIWKMCIALGLMKMGRIFSGIREEAKGKEGGRRGSLLRSNVAELLPHLNLVAGLAGKVKLFGRLKDEDDGAAQ